MMLTKNINQMIEETQAHIKVDQVEAGKYWNPKTKKGGFMGCLTHSSNANLVTEKYGIPLPLVRILEGLFERLSKKNTGDGIEFFGAIPTAIAIDNKDLSKVHWKFLKDCLEHLPKQDDLIQAVINPVIKGIGLLSQGKYWPRARDAANAAYTAYALVYAAYPAHAAHVTAYALVYAAYPAHAADPAYAAYAANAANATRVADATVNAAYAASYAADAALAADAARAAAHYAAALACTDAADSETKRQAKVLLKLIKHAPVKESA